MCDFLQHFPELVQSPTIEGTLPLHIASAEGHLPLVTLILNFTYPRIMRQIYRDNISENFYKLGFPINAKDGRSHSALHEACYNNRPEVVETLLNFQVKIVDRESFNTSTDSETMVDDVMEEEEEDGGLGARLGVEESEMASESPDVSEATEDMYEPGAAPIKKDYFCPVEVDSLDLDGRTPLHLAVKGDGKQGFHRVAQLLLEHGANPNKPIISPSGNSTILMEACITGDVEMIDLLLKYKAQDVDLKVLSAATLSLNSDMAAVLLKYKTYRDSEYKINKQAIHSQPTETGAEGETEACDSLSHVCPSNPTTVNWHALNLQHVEAMWLEEAALLQNPNLLTHRTLSLHAITRIDVSNNNLTQIPSQVFLLKSLRLLNISENKIVSLPGDTSRYDSALVVYGNHSNSANIEPPPSPAQLVPWELPVLEEFQCYKNKLKTVPSQVFKLPALKRLNFAQNELERLPLELWKSPALLELNLSSNRLRELPVGFAMSQQMSSDTISLDSSVDLNPEESSNLSSSGPGTPKRMSTTTSNASSHGSSSGTSDRDINASVSEDTSPLLISPGRPYTEQDVEQISYWRDNLRIRASLGATEPSHGADKGTMSHLQELNLSHNLFDSVPSGLPCLVPNLSKLILSHNRLSHVGALSLYPAGLKMLDLSYNMILNHVLFECVRFDDEHFAERWATRTCYNPSPRKQ